MPGSTSELIHPPITSSVLIRVTRVLDHIPVVTRTETQSHAGRLTSPSQHTLAVKGSPESLIKSKPP